MEAPGRCTAWLLGGQPVAEEVAVQRVQHEALGAAGRAGHDAHVLRGEAALEQPRAGPRTGQDGRGSLGHQCRSVRLALKEVCGRLSPRELCTKPPLSTKRVSDTPGSGQALPTDRRRMAWRLKVHIA